MNKARELMGRHLPYFSFFDHQGTFRPFRAVYLVLLTALVLNHSWWWAVLYLVDATFKPDPRRPTLGVKRTGERSK